MLHLILSLSDCVPVCALHHPCCFITLPYTFSSIPFTFFFGIAFSATSRMMSTAGTPWFVDLVRNQLRELGAETPFRRIRLLLAAKSELRSGRSRTASDTHYSSP